MELITEIKLRTALKAHTHLQQIDGSRPLMGVSPNRLRAFLDRFSSISEAGRACTCGSRTMYNWLSKPQSMDVNKACKLISHMMQCLCEKEWQLRSDPEEALRLVCCIALESSEYIKNITTE